MKKPCAVLSPREAAEKLGSVALAGVDVRLRVAEQADIVVPLPARAVEMIVAVLDGDGGAQANLADPHTAELTTNQAADFLNVSRPHLVGCSKKSRSVPQGWQPSSHPRIGPSGL